MQPTTVTPLPSFRRKHAPYSDTGPESIGVLLPLDGEPRLEVTPSLTLSPVEG